MKGVKMNLVFKTVLVAICAFGLPNTSAQLRTDYYTDFFWSGHYCPLGIAKITSIISNIVWLFPEAAPQLLRMHFHDCFVNGCDGSSLIFKSDHTAERDGFPNANSLAGFEYIDQAKAAVEKICPGVFSCADIVAQAARDAVQALSFLPGNTGLETWLVEYGRGDGNVSTATDANNNLPSPFANITTLKDIFARKNLTTKQLVLLSGAHTIGDFNCTVINSLIYDSAGNPINSSIYTPAYSAYMRTKCPFGTITVRRAMKDMVDVPWSTNQTFDNYYYVNDQELKGMFPSDHALTTSNDTNFWVNFYAGNIMQFRNDFGSAMIQMGRTDVKPPGYARKNCSVLFS